ncbi:MAG TPA: ThiF family adenylyltransferase, partial [Thermoanaerobaculia bacterium]
CGALGSRAAELLARAGVGRAADGLLRLIDRDYVDLSNLQRQALFDTEDARQARPKAAAAKRHIAAIDADVRTEAHVRDVSPENAERLLDGVDLVVDGTDNFRTRFLVNDVAVLRGMPWIYGGAVASRGVVAAFVPGAGPCFRCLLEQVPALAAGETCDTAGIVTTVPALVASMEVSYALRWIVEAKAPRGLRRIDLWTDDPSWDAAFAGSAADPECPTCGLGEFPALRGERQDAVSLCGRNSVQIVGSNVPDLDAASLRLGRSGLETHRHAQSLTVRIPEGAVTLFEDGRVIVEGTIDTMEATTLVAKYLGG